MRTSHRIALAYFLLSAVWILVTDKVFYVLFPELFHTISLYKDWIFITISACALFIFIRQKERDRDTVETALQHAAITDPLTGLRNRAALFSHLEHALEKAKRGHAPFGLIFVDVDNFKIINDEKGHSAGDMYLKAIAQTIASSIRSSDIAARFGGDEFVVFAGNGDDLTILAHRLLEAFQIPIEVEGNHVPASISLGIARYPEHGENIDDILNAADKAMYTAKSSGKGCIREAP